MKKTSKEPAVDAQDLIATLNKLQEQIASLEKKLDLIVSKVDQNFVQTRPQAPYQAPQVQNQPSQPNQSRQFQGRDGGFNHNRPLFKAVCADCSKDCELPFRPSPGRAVYCKECFSKRKSGNNNQPKPAEVKSVSLSVPSPVTQAVPEVAEPKKASVKKAKPTAKKRKK